MSEDILPSTAAPLSIKQRAHALYLQLEQCLEANDGGGSNPEALRQMKGLGLRLKWTSSLFSEKVGSLVHWAEILYSPRKHTQWDQPTVSGADRVRDFMRRDLASIDAILKRMSDCP